MDIVDYFPSGDQADLVPVDDFVDEGSAQPEISDAALDQAIKHCCTHYGRFEVPYHFRAEIESYGPAADAIPQEKRQGFLERLALHTGREVPWLPRRAGHTLNQPRLWRLQGADGSRRAGRRGRVRGLTAVAKLYSKNKRGKLDHGTDSEPVTRRV
jgi:hypothetical protein